MQVQNKYIRYREEVAKTRGGKIDEPPRENAKTPTKLPTSSTPAPIKSMLPTIEKNKAPTQIPLAGGGARRLDYSGPLSDKLLDRLQQLYPLYKQAERKTQVNWKILAGIHYRESRLGLDPGAKGNELQFYGDLKKRATGDLGKDLVEAGKILQEKAAKGFYSSKAKKWLVPRVSPLREDQSDGENVRTAVFLYNGPIYRTRAAPGAPAYDRSPYVLNRLDSEHWDMDLYRGKNAKSVWGIDHRLGVIPFVRELEKAFPEG